MIKEIINGLYMTQKTVFGIVVLVVALAVGGWFWYGFISGDKTMENRNSEEKILTNINLDTTTWKEYRSHDLGITFKLPQEWKFNDQEFSILPVGKSGGWVFLWVYSWPDYLKNKIGKEFSISQVLTDKSLGYIDRYHFVIVDNSLKEAVLPLGRGVEYSRASKRFRSSNEPDGSVTKSREFMIYDEKNGKTYQFIYNFFADSYDPNIDKAFEEVVKTVRVLE